MFFHSKFDTNNYNTLSIMKIKNIIAALALIAIPALSFAQTNKSNEELSTEYKLKINVLKSEIKTLKAKQKAEPSVASYVTEMNEKKAELKSIQNKKAIVDKAIKTEKARKKAVDKLEKAKAKAEQAAKDAENMKKGK